MKLNPVTIGGLKLKGKMMPSNSFFAITSMVIAVLSLLLFLNQRVSAKLQTDALAILSENQKRQIDQNKTLTNLLLSKDPMTFQQLQVTPSVQQFESHDQVHPLNDEAVAAALAESYQKAGIDPKFAYAQQDEVNFGQEFGL